MKRPFSLRTSKQRILTIVSVIFYVMVFNWTYRQLVVPTYDYWGLSYNPPAFGYLFLSWLVSLIPAFWMPVEFKRPSLLLFYFQYFILFIPSVFVLYNSSKPILPPEVALALVLLMFAGLSIIQSIYLLPIIRFKRIKIRYFLLFFYIVIVALLGYVIQKLAGNFRLANLTEIYKVRSVMNEIVSASGSRFGFYAQTWLAGFFLPFCFAIGAFAKRWRIIVFVAIGYLILFGVGGSKTTLFSMVYLTFVYLWLTRIKRYVTSAFAWGLSVLLLVPGLLGAVLPSVITTWYIAIVHVRTFTIPSLLISQYYEFFQNNPLTYMSHVNGVNRFINYPYDKPYSMIIGDYYYGGIINSNAGFWAGDGLAGFGPQGIIIMSFICAILLYLLDSLSRRYEPRFVAVMITFSATSFMNAPLSITLLTGGLGFSMLVLLILPNKGLLEVAFKKPLGKDFG